MDQSRLIKNFFNLVKIDSPTGEEKAVGDFLVDFLKKNDLVDEVEKDEIGNIFAKVAGEGEPLFILDHMDTVEPGRGIEPKIDGEYIVSSGETILGADDKSSVAAVLETLFVLKEQKITHRPLEILFTVSEEVGSVGAWHFDYSRLKSKNGICFDSSLPLGTLVVAAPFYERFDVVIHGKSAHASRPELGLNPVNVLTEVLSGLEFGKVDDETVFNIGVIQGGYVRNSIPDQIELKGEIRSFEESKLIAQKEKLTQLLDESTTKLGAKYTLEFVRENDGYKFSQDQVEALSNKLEPIFQKYNIKVNPFSYWGCSDANIVNPKGLFVYSIGGGREFAHTTRERIKVKDLETLVQIMRELFSSR